MRKLRSLFVSPSIRRPSKKTNEFPTNIQPFVHYRTINASLSRYSCQYAAPSFLLIQVQLPVSLSQTRTISVFFSAFMSKDALFREYNLFLMCI